MAMNVQLVDTTNTGSPGYKQGVSETAAHILPTTVGVVQARSRQIATQDGTATTLTWTTPVKEVTITVFQEAVGTAELRAVLGVCFDAPSTLVATTWLTPADYTASDSNLYVVLANECRTFYFAGDGITRMDVDRLYGTENLGVIVEAA